jgi:hypothetical protein
MDMGYLILWKSNIFLLHDHALVLRGDLRRVSQFRCKSRQVPILRSAIDQLYPVFQLRIVQENLYVHKLYRYSLMERADPPFPSIFSTQEKPHPPPPYPRTHLHCLGLNAVMYLFEVKDQNGQHGLICATNSVIS